MANTASKEMLKSNQNETVVLNDTLEDNLFESTQKVIKALNVEREKWESTLLRKSNQALYQILTQCYELYQLASGSTKEAISRRAALEAVRKEYNYRFLDSTPLITKIVKCVFGVERRRVSAYSIVLREAIALGVEPADLAEWIEKNGGVEQVRLSKSPNAITVNEKAKLAQEVIEEGKPLGVVNSKELSQLADADKAGEQCILLAVQNADGSFSVTGLVEHKGAVTTALSAYYSQHKKQLEQRKKEDTANSSVSKRDRAVDEAVAA